MKRVGFLGAGRMAQALARGLINSGFTKPRDITASSPPQDAEILDKFQDMGCQVTFSNSEVAKASDVIMVAVKPPLIHPVLKEISSEVTMEKLVVSVALGVSLKTMEHALSPGSRVIRAMPNTPSLVLEGASVFAKGSSVTEADCKLAQDIFSCVGSCSIVPENIMDAVAALSGSGPAYIYVIIEALADGGVRMGIPRDLALKLAAQTVKGAAEMVLKENKHPGVLKDEVTSPSGSTIYGLYNMETRGVRAIFMETVEKACHRATQLGQQCQQP